MKQFFRIIIFIIVGSFVGCYGDSIYSNYLFEQYCNEEGRTGQFIYERVGLSEEYFIPIPFTKEGVELHFDRGFLIDEGKLLIDKNRLMKDFIINTMKRTMLSSIGPIYAYETTIIRETDGKVLSKAVSLMNHNGWLARQSILGTNVGDTCPKYKDISGHVNVKSDHSDVLRNTFYKGKSYDR
jgi:hypothetical protein